MLTAPSVSCFLPGPLALTLLIKDEDATVRIKCSEAMSMLYDY